MEKVLILVVLALVGESVWETLKMTWQDGKISTDRIGALVVGLLITFGTGLDILALIDIPAKIPFLGMVLTGILISRGSNFIHDLLIKVSNPSNRG